MPITDNKGIEDNHFVVAHKEICRNLLKVGDHSLKCLHCGTAISENGSPLVEIDEDGIDLALGIIHNRCLRPIDRVLGTVTSEIFEKYDYLKNFDYKEWFEKVQTGQAMFLAARGKLNQVVNVGWHPEGGSEYKGNYCIKLNLEDGSSRYATHRG